MLLSQTKEREYRFKLALRMVLPIFALVIALIFNTLIDDSLNFSTSFLIESILLLAVSIYFILYIIYKGFDVQITEIVTKTFTREYLYNYLKKEIKKNNSYTLALISVDNIHDINSIYGIKNGDKVLFEVVKWIEKEFENKGISNYPLGHIKGGDFVLGLKGLKTSYSTLINMICLKSSEFKVNDIEVKISTAITDTTFSNELEYMIENLFEIQELNKVQKTKLDQNINPNELESLVIKALNNRSFILSTQNVFENKKIVAKECFVKLKHSDSKIIHQKSYMKVISKLGLVVEYDLMILEKIIFHCDENTDFFYAVNINPSSLRNHVFLSKMKELLRENSYSMGKIILILSENEYYSYIERYNSIIRSLQNFGVKIAVDRLGAIHTSFLYLRDLNIDIVRFDNYYIKNLEYKNIIDGFNSMAHSKGMKTWVKMVESEEILSIVEDINIDYIQGKYLSELEKFYES